MSIKWDRLLDVLQVVLGLIAWSWVAYKAIAIPITHDELATIVHYRHFSVWEIMMYPDPWPNNHILNTLLAKASLALFGQEQWAARLPSVLSFGLYGGAAFYLGRLLFPDRPLFRLGVFTLFIANPYLLDFFSLCRGYGMANAFFLAASAALVLAWVRTRAQAIWWSVLLITLAAYANFTLLTFWVPIILLSGLYLLAFSWGEESRRFGGGPRLLPPLLLLGWAAAFLALIWTPLRKMSSSDQFQYWESNSFYQDTIWSLIISSRYSSPHADGTVRLVGVALGLCCLAAVIYCIVLGYRRGWRALMRRPIGIALGILLLAVLTNRMQGWVLGTPNLTNRTALAFYPAFILLLGAGLVESIRWQLAMSRLLIGGLFLFSLWHGIASANPGSVREWWYDAHTFTVLDLLGAEARKADHGTISLGTSWQFHRSFDFYERSGRYPWLELRPDSRELHLSDPPDYYYVMSPDVDGLGDQYELIASYEDQFFLFRYTGGDHGRGAGSR